MDTPEEILRETFAPLTEKKIEAPSIILSGNVGKTEEFKRPDHYDFMDAKELKEAKFSGSRHSIIDNHVEVWIEGERVLREAYDWVRWNPEKWAKLYSDALQLKEVEVLPIERD